jgi:hypothetical protein
MLSNVECSFLKPADAGSIPESWSIGIIKPIYKNKGDVKDTDNFQSYYLDKLSGETFYFNYKWKLTFFHERSVIDFL